VATPTRGTDVVGVQRQDAVGVACSDRRVELGEHGGDRLHVGLGGAGLWVTARDQQGAEE
jgi:hypothetical protein